MDDIEPQTLKTHTQTHTLRKIQTRTMLQNIEENWRIKNLYFKVQPVMQKEKKPTKQTNKTSPSHY